MVIYEVNYAQTCFTVNNLSRNPKVNVAKSTRPLTLASDPVYVNKKMADVFSLLAAPTPSHPSTVNRFFQSASASGGDSPRTITAEEIFKLHISTPPIQQEDLQPFHLETPCGKKKRRPRINQNSLSQNSLLRSSFSGDVLSGLSPAKRRSPSPEKVSPVRLEEMDMGKDTLSPTPLSACPQTTPPHDTSDSDSDEDTSELARPDANRLYFRQKKRAEQISAYRNRELKYDRELRYVRRRNSLAPKSAKVTKLRIKKVTFTV